jgi:hypothetical protein
MNPSLFIPNAAGLQKKKPYPQRKAAFALAKAAHTDKGYSFLLKPDRLFDWFEL